MGLRGYGDGGGKIEYGWETDCGGSRSLGSISPRSISITKTGDRKESSLVVAQE